MVCGQILCDLANSYQAWRNVLVPYYTSSTKHQSCLNNLQFGEQNIPSLLCSLQRFSFHMSIEKWHFGVISFPKLFPLIVSISLFNFLNNLLIRPLKHRASLSVNPISIKGFRKTFTSPKDEPEHKNSHPGSDQMFITLSATKLNSASNFSYTGAKHNLNLQN